MRYTILSCFYFVQSPIPSIGGDPQYATPAKNKYFSHPSLIIHLFLPTPPIKLKQGQQIGGGTTNSKPPGPIIMMGRSETLSSSQIQFITLFFCSCTGLLRLLAKGGKVCAIMLWQNHFPEPNQTYFDFSSPNFIVQDHHITYWALLEMMLLGTHTYIVCHIPTKIQFWTQYKDKACMKVSERTQCQDQLSIFLRKSNSNTRLVWVLKEISIPTPGWYVQK